MPLHPVSNAHGALAAPAQDRLPVRTLHAARALAAEALRAAAVAAFASLLGACAAPPIDRYLLQAEDVRLDDVRLKGGRGMLSAAQSKAIIEQLRKRAPDSGALEKHIAIEEALAGSTVSIGNRVVLLQDGADTYTAMLKAIRGAKHHVHMESYIFEADDTGKEFAAALVERVQAGVKVRLIYDGVGSNKTPKEFFKDMAASGVEVVEFNPLGPATVMKGGLAGLNHRDHRKLTVVDGRVAFLGGINISDVYGSISSGSLRRGGKSDGDTPIEERPWRDVQSLIDGPAVADLQRAFLGQWSRQKKEDAIEDKDYYPTLSNQGSNLVRAIEGSPDDQRANAMYMAFISAVDTAENEVLVMNPYFVPHQELRRALIDAARRGVDVKLLLPGHSDSWLTYHAGRSFYEDLLEAGVKIFERQERMLHAKTATIDSVWSTVGSSNLDWRSLLYNEEINIVVLGTDFAAQMSGVFRRDLAQSEEITHEKWRDRPISERLKEVAARVWARFL